MPKKVFVELEKEKQDRIGDAALKEFAEYGYENGSTNRIVKECGISKGSLFKYFDNKEELYFYLIDTVYAEMAAETSVDISKMSKDLFERVIEYSAAEISWYISHPIEGKFMIGVAAEAGSEIGKKTIERYGEKSSDIYDEFLKGVDMSGFSNSRREVTDILRWVLTGFNNSFLQSASPNDDVEKLKKEYIRQLRKHLKVLKNGL